MSTVLPPIPAKRYFTIGEVAELCGVKPHVLRYWEQEFTQLRPMKRRGNRRYYQHHEVLMVRRIRDLLYDQGFTISGARNRLQELAHSGKAGVEQFAVGDAEAGDITDGVERDTVELADPSIKTNGYGAAMATPVNAMSQVAPLSIQAVRKELQEIRALLSWV
ncbi:MerR family transcriptional regulator [Diaphorobacter sp. HDW4A]|uniref:MerR family transcriptional regulator n=1 Tax=Diaphorobacter sp. HDW4A TaxID=2714924 RepID=UPI00140A9F1E|nr:MerR family transcriptional regulator [Diaphorobacter sp. HDW4A]QIL79236.1 MerR family transcriptional regulator [Diaphorobacter sp. HDW4A]